MLKQFIIVEETIDLSWRSHIQLQLTHFSPVMLFIEKPAICFAERNK